MLTHQRINNNVGFKVFVIQSTFKFYKYCAQNMLQTNNLGVDNED